MNQDSSDAAKRFSIEVVRKLRDAGYEALLAGGCVRDMLMGRTPKDYDVATNAHPEQIREVFGRRGTLPIGAAFGVIAVVGPKEVGLVEVATFRQDAEYSDGRHPDSVTFTTAEEDAQRRDFTINGIFFDPLEQRCIDYVDGQRDIERKRIRAIGDPADRFREDKLRMLRAIRFASTLDFELDPGTLEAIRDTAETIEQVSAERISQELRRMLLHSRRGRALRLLERSRLLRLHFPEVVLAVAPSSDPPVDSAWGRMLAIAERLAEPTFAVVLAVLLRATAAASEQGLEVIDLVGRRLKLTNEEVDGSHYLLQHERLIRGARGEPWPRLQRVLITPRVDELMDYAQAVAEVEGGLEDVAYCREKLALPKEQLNPEPLITGSDLKRLGFRPGPLFKEILDAIRDQQLDGELTTRAAATEKILATWKAEG